MAHATNPEDDTRLILHLVLEALNQLRHEFDVIDRTGTLRRLYERFARELREHGFPLTGLEGLDRAKGFRALGELAEQHGDRVAAVRFYREALAGWEDVGCRLKLRRLERRGWGQSADG